MFMNVYTEDIIHFKLRNGQSGSVAPEARRTYDAVIWGNLGIHQTNGLTDEQARLVFDKSQLREDVLESIWQTTGEIDAQGRADGAWGQLEVYVALHFLQAAEELSLDAMHSQFAGPFSPPTRKITRRSSYATAPSNPSGSPIVQPPVELPAAFSRSQSLYEAPMRGFKTSSTQDPPSEQHSGSASKASQYRFRKLRESNRVSHAGSPNLETVEDVEEDPCRPYRTQPYSWSTSFDSRVDQIALKASEAEQCTNKQLTTVRGSAGEPYHQPLRQRNGLLVRSSTQTTSYQDSASHIPGLSRNHRMSAPAIRTESGKETHQLHWQSLPATQAFADTHWLPHSPIVTGSNKRISTTTGKRQKLANIIAAQTPNIVLAPMLQAPAAVPRRSYSPVDDREARNLLEAQRERGSNNHGTVSGLGRILKSKADKDKAKDKSKWTSSKNECNKVLRHVIEQNGNVGVIEALLDFGADVNVFKDTTDSTIKRLRGRDVTATSSNYIQMAASNNQFDTVSLLARRGAWPQSISEALASAAHHRHLGVMRVLLQHDADPNFGEGRVFLEAVSSQDASLVRLLLQARRPIDKILLDNSLPHAVSSGEAGIVTLLVTYGANVDHDFGSALCKAVPLGRFDLLVAVARGRPCTNSASLAFENILASNYLSSTSDAYLIIEILLCAGASGEAVDKALVHTVNAGQKELALLLVDGGASANYEKAKALKLAVRQGALELVKIFVRGEIEASHVSEAFDEIPKPFDEGSIYRLMSALISCGASGEPLAQALITAVKHRMWFIVTLLLEANVSVDYKDAKALQIAVAEGETDIVRKLLPKAEQQRLPMHVLFSLVPKHFNRVRLELVTLLMSHHATGEYVTEALIQVLGESPVQKDLLRALLDDKKSVNLLKGKVLEEAAMLDSHEFLEIILAQGQPDEWSCLAALQVALTPSALGREHIVSLLVDYGISQKAKDQALIREAGNAVDCNVEILKLLKRCGADCDYQRGRTLEKAIRAKQLKVLQLLLESGKPRKGTVARQIPTAMEDRNRESKFATMKLLLDACEPGVYIDAALLAEIKLGRQTDARLVDHLIRCGAQVDYLDGAVIQSVLQHAARPGLLKLLLSGRYDPNILASKIPHAMANTGDLRRDLLSILLCHGASGLPLHKALVDAAAEGDQALSTIALLIQHHASVDFLEGRALVLAASMGAVAVLQILISNWETPRPNSLTEAFRLTMPLPGPTLAQPSPARQRIVEILTKSYSRWLALVPALEQACSEGDHNLVGHLIAQGADPNANNGHCVTIAVMNFDLRSVSHLVKGKPNPTICSRAFSTIATHPDRSSNQQSFVQMAEISLQSGATGEAVDQALIDCIQTSDRSGYHLLQVLLTASPGPNVNFASGKVLQLTVRKNDLDLAVMLLTKGPDPQTLSLAFSSLFESTAGEADLVAMAQSFFNHTPKDKHIYYSTIDQSKSPLYQCLHRHSDKPKLLQLLIDNECPMYRRFSWGFVKAIGREDVSPLLWLLYQADGNTSEELFRILLRYSDINFRTKGSGMTPLAVAAAYASSGVIKGLLQAGADVLSEDHAGRTPLYFAATTGAVSNMELLIAAGASCNDESLHVAVRNLNVQAVHLLLKQTANVNAPGFIASEGRSPLGELCLYGNFEKRPSEVKRILVTLLQASPNLDLIADGKSMLLLSLDNASPLKMTRMLLTASPKLCTSINDDTHLYKTEHGRCYSPTMYVRHFKSKRLGEELQKLLRAFGCTKDKDRFWDEDAGADQPEGACGLPEHIKAAQREQSIQRKHEREAARRQQEEEARLVAELIRLEAIQAQQEADIAHQRRLRNEEREAQIAEVAEETRREQARIQAEQDAQNREFEDQRRRNKALAKDMEETERRRAKVWEDAMRKEASIEKEVIRERKKLLDSVKEAMIMSGDGAGGQRQVGMGRILGELEY